MPQVLQNKNLATKFQILVEIIANQPNVQQKNIAKKLSITPQAVSEYVMKMEEDGWVVSEGRSRYRVTREAINWVLRELRDLQSYLDFVRSVVTNITVCAAVADCDLLEGQSVGLVMKQGLLVATANAGDGAKGIAVSSAQKGEDVGISGIEGIVDLQPGMITILKVPDIQRGGSRKVDLARLKYELGKERLVGAMGIEAMSSLRRVDCVPDYVYGVTEASIEAAHTGLPFLIICTIDEIPNIIKRLEDEAVPSELLELSIGSNQ